ncbi:MAG: GNAT family N-acetyltransferase [Candidatus Paceibacterota bacterium]|jgi:RimJ/RimL family protein N-acetyltransferase
MFSDHFDVTLGAFNQEYFDGLPNADSIVAPTFDNEDFYHTVYVDGRPIGVAGVVPSKVLPDTGFTQIVLAPDWRGLGLIGPIYDKLADWHDLHTLYATININNKISQHAHQKLGFKFLSDKKIADLRERELIDKDETRMVKEVI